MNLKKKWEALASSMLGAAVGAFWGMTPAIIIVWLFDLEGSSLMFGLLYAGGWGGYLFGHHVGSSQKPEEQGEVARRPLAQPDVAYAITHLAKVLTDARAVQIAFGSAKVRATLGTKHAIEFNFDIEHGHSIWNTGMPPPMEASIFTISGFAGAGFALVAAGAAGAAGC